MKNWLCIARYHLEVIMLARIVNGMMRYGLMDMVEQGLY